MSPGLQVYQDVQPSYLPVDTTDEMLVEIWLSLKRSKQTRVAYRQDIAMFLAFTGNKPLHSVTLADAQEYAQRLEGKPTTKNRKLASLKSLFSFGHETGYLPFNVTSLLQLATPEDKLAQRILTEEQIISMIALELVKRNHTFLRLLYHCGLRVSEIVALQWSDLIERDAGGQVTVYGKGNKTRQVLIAAEMWQELMRLPDHTGFVFKSRRSKKGEGIKSWQAWAIVRQAAQRACIELDVSPHFYRHSSASHALDRGAPIHLVQQNLGHASLATTSKYVHARPDDGIGKYLPL